MKKIGLRSKWGSIELYIRKVYVREFFLTPAIVLEKTLNGTIYLSLKWLKYEAGFRIVI